MYYYNYKDHLGNVRITYMDDGSGVPYIVEEENYYPFGLKHSGYNETPMYGKDWGSIIVNRGELNYRYKYNGKELQDELGLNMYDYGARLYESAIGRWVNIDPLAEISTRFTPYAYAMNNPVFFIDPDGRYASDFDNSHVNSGLDGVETDFKVLSSGEDKGKVVRVDPNDGTEKDATDRIFMTNKKGEVNSKPAISNIAKGIVRENMNLRTDSEVIKIDGVGQPTINEFASFLVEYSKKISGTEISGFGAVSFDGTQKYVMTEPYKNNTFEKNVSMVLGMNTAYYAQNSSFYVNSHFHTHPDNHGYTYEKGLSYPSDEDINGYNRRSEKNGVAMPHFIFIPSGIREYNSK